MKTICLISVSFIFVSGVTGGENQATERTGVGTYCITTATPRPSLRRSSSSSSLASQLLEPGTMLEPEKRPMTARPARPYTSTPQTDFSQLPGSVGGEDVGGETELKKKMPPRERPKAGVVAIEAAAPIVESAGGAGVQKDGTHRRKQLSTTYSERSLKRKLGVDLTAPAAPHSAETAAPAVTAQPPHVPTVSVGNNKPPTSGGLVGNAPGASSAASTNDESSSCCTIQ